MLHNTIYKGVARAAARRDLSYDGGRGVVGPARRRGRRKGIRVSPTDRANELVVVVVAIIAQFSRYSAQLPLKRGARESMKRFYGLQNGVTAPRELYVSSAFPFCRASSLDSPLDRSASSRPPEMVSSPHFRKILPVSNTRD